MSDFEIIAFILICTMSLYWLAKMIIDAPECDENGNIIAPKQEDDCGYGRFEQ